MFDVFVAYSRRDQEKAKRLTSLLEAEGLRVWWDINISPGEVWRDVILKNLDAARAVIVLWSHFSVNSEWVRAEAQIAADRMKLIPILIDRIEIPLGFSHYQHLDLSSWDGSPDAIQIRALRQVLRAMVDSAFVERPPTEYPKQEPGAKTAIEIGREYKSAKHASSIRVFVAHASADKPRLAPILTALLDQKFRVWIDKPQLVGLPAQYESKITLDRIHYGSDWRDDIRKAIQRADIVLALWSQDAVKGRREQFHYEVYQGMMQKKLHQCRIDAVEFDQIGMPYTFDQIADLAEMVLGAYHPEMDYLMQDMTRKRRSWWSM
jgi:TIR domain